MNSTRAHRTHGTPCTADGRRGRGLRSFGTLGRSMDRDATVTLALILFAAAALAVGASGWVLWIRDHRLVKAASAAPVPAHHEVTEEE
jgi:hypothetical protein